MTSFLENDDRLQGFGRRLLRVRRVAWVLAPVDLIVWVVIDSIYGQNSHQGDVATGILGNLLFVLLALSVTRIATLSISKEIVVSAEPSRVFALVSDPQNWMGISDSWRHVEAVKQLPSGGTTGTVSLRRCGTMDWETIEYSPYRRVVTFARTTGAALSPQVSLAQWSLEPSPDGGTRVRCQQKIRLHDFAGILQFYGRRWMDRTSDRTLALLMARLRTEASDVPPKEGAV